MIRAIREALGMSGVQFAKRLGVSPQRVATLEKAEVTGAVTIRSMRQAAEALDCVFVHALVPRSSLKDTVRRQALEVARERLKHTSHTMLLEDQQLSKEKMRKALDAAVEELVDAMPKGIMGQAGMNLDSSDGATPLDPNEIEGLRLGHIATRAELDRWEQDNITEGSVGVRSQAKGPPQ